MNIIPKFLKGKKLPTALPAGERYAGGKLETWLDGNTSYVDITRRLWPSGTLFKIRRAITPNNDYQDLVGRFHSVPSDTTYTEYIDPVLPFINTVPRSGSATHYAESASPVYHGGNPELNIRRTREVLGDYETMKQRFNSAERVTRKKSAPVKRGGTVTRHQLGGLLKAYWDEGTRLWNKFWDDQALLQYLADANKYKLLRKAVNKVFGEKNNQLIKRTGVGSDILSGSPQSYWDSPATYYTTPQGNVISGLIVKAPGDTLWVDNGNIDNLSQARLKFKANEGNTKKKK